MLCNKNMCLKHVPLLIHDCVVRSEFFTTQCSLQHREFFTTHSCMSGCSFIVVDGSWQWVIYLDLKIHRGCRVCSKLLTLTTSYGVEISFNLSKIQQLLFNDLSYRTKQINYLFYKKTRNCDLFLLGCSCWKSTRMWMQTSRSQTRRSVRTRRTGCRRRRATMRVTWQHRGTVSTHARPQETADWLITACQLIRPSLTS